MKRLGFFLILTLAVGCTRPSGPVLVYEVEEKHVDMQGVAEVVDERINPGRTRRGQVRVLGDRWIEITLIRNDPDLVQKIDRLVQLAGTLEFRILANTRDHPSLIQQARQTDDRVVHNENGEVLAWWVPVKTGREEDFAEAVEIGKRPVQQNGPPAIEILVVNDVFDIDGSYLLRAVPGVAQTGGPCVKIMFSSDGGKLFGALTGDNLPAEAEGFSRKLGIIINGFLYSAPAIRGTITRHAEITGDFTAEEVDELVDVLNAGSLPVTLKKVDRQTPADER